MSVYSLFKRVLPESLKRRIRPILRGWHPSIIESCLRKELGKNIFFVQVGSNDGKLGDPLYKHIRRNKKWRGIFIEPLPYLFDRLKQNYGDENRFVFVNVAISEEAGDREFFYVAPSAKESLDLPNWYDQLGSFDPMHIRKHFGDQIDPFIVSKKIPCQTLHELLSANNVQKVDLFHIDTEGYDYHVLKQLDFTRYQPRIIIYEHKHLSVKEKRSSSNILTANGYNCVEVGGDTVGVRHRVWKFWPI